MENKNIYIYIYNMNFKANQMKKKKLIKELTIKFKVN